MNGKLQDQEFLSSTDMILNPGIDYVPSEAYHLVHDQLISKLRKEE